MPQQSSPKPLKEPLEPPKAPLGEPWETPRSTLPAALGAPRSSPEPPRREHANGCRGSTNSALPARAPWTPILTQPPPALNLPLTLPAHTVLAYPLPQASPHAGPIGVGGLTGLRPLPPTPKEDLAVSNMRMARSDISYEYLDEGFNPTIDVGPR